MRKVWIVLVALALFGSVALGMGSCGDDGESCPGKVCSNCGGSGDCDMQCGSNQINVCGHLGLFDDPNLRCSYCEDR